MVQIPDSLRQQLAPVLKHHFWILAALVPVVLVPALFMAAADRRKVIASERTKIDGHVSALKSVQTKTDHPNAAWAKAFDRQAATVRKELLAEWTALWTSQQSLRVWPEVLGRDFLGAIAAVESGSRKDLQPAFKDRYQNTLPDIVRQLPARMGCEDLMGDAEDAAGQGLGFGARRPGGPGRPFGGGIGDDAEATRSPEVLVWKPEDQKRLLGSFTWAKAPSTTQVLLAQEELWVYGLLCDAIKRINEGSTAMFDARITTVDELAVGYLAAEDKPGGQGGGRILAGMLPIGGGMGGLEDGMAGAEPGMEATGESSELFTGRPPNPRFSGGGVEGLEGLGQQLPAGLAAPPGMPPGPGESMEGGEAAGPSLTYDDMLKQWIYVDFTGRPLTAPELATAPDARLVHLMPFVLRVVIDQREIDRLLAELASNPVPIDVRQVRINPSAQTGGEGGGFGGPRGGLPSMPGGLGGPMPGGGAEGERRRPFDVILELRGTVGLATPPDPAALGQITEGEAAAGGGEGA